MKWFTNWLFDIIKGFIGQLIKVSDQNRTFKLAAFFFSLCFVLVFHGVLFSNSLQAEPNPPTFNNPELACSDLSLESYTAKPMTYLAISGLPEDYSGDLVANIYVDGEYMGIALADQRDADDKWFLISPANPMFTADAIDVTLAFEDDHIQCEPFDFKIEEIEIDPLDLDLMVNEFESMIEIAAEAFDLSIDELAEMDESNADLEMIPLIVISKQLRGNEGYMNFREQFTQERLGEDFSDDEWDLFLTLYKRLHQQNPASADIKFDNTRSILDSSGQTGYEIHHRQENELWASAGNVTAPRYWGNNVDISVSAINTPICDRIYFEQNAKQLQLMLWSYQRIKETLKRFELSDQIKTYGIAAVSIYGAVKGGPVGQHIGRTTATAATSFSLVGYTIKYLEALFPNEVWGFHIREFGPDEFLEDAQVLEGKWDKAFVSASNKEFDLSQNQLGVLWDAAGGEILNRLRLTVSSGIIDGMMEANRQVYTEGFGQIIENLSVGFDTIPACEFGPIEVTEDEWTRSYTYDGDDVVERVDHQNYRVNNVGVGHLEICLLDTIYQNPFTSNPASASCISEFRRAQPIEVKPIEVRAITINPPNMRGTRFVAPGTVIDLEGIVSNAEDETLSWDIEPSGQHTLTTYSNGKEATVITSDDEDDFPFIITVESLSFSGLRAKPNAPPREYSIIVDATETEEFVDCRDDTPIRMQNLTPCSFIAFMEGPDIRLLGYPDFSANHCYTGSIQSMGTNQHGVFNMNWSGAHEGRAMRGVMVRIYPPDNTLYTYETEGVTFGGNLEFEYETERRRSPISRETVTATALALHTFTTENREIILYPLEGTDLWAGRFEAEVIMNESSRGRRDTGNQSIIGVFLLGEACMWEIDDDE